MTEFYFRSGNEENGVCVFHRYTISLVGVSAQLFFITDVRIIEATPYVFRSCVFYPSKNDMKKNLCTETVSNPENLGCLYRVSEILSSIHRLFFPETYLHFGIFKKS
jgi:hypothetical protein